MFYLLIILLMASALAAIWLIDQRIYAGFDDAPDGYLERFAGFLAIPAVFLWLIYEMIRTGLRYSANDQHLTFADFWHYLRWVFSSDEA